MRKAILHIIFLSLLLTTGAHACITAIPHQAEAKAIINKSIVADTDTLSHSGDLLVDLDDYDEYETDHTTASLKEKQAAAVMIFATARQLFAQVVTPSSFANNYNHYNFSRLPRHNFISLRVLRI